MSFTSVSPAILPPLGAPISWRSLRWRRAEENGDRGGATGMRGKPPQNSAIELLRTNTHCTAMASVGHLPQGDVGWVAGANHLGLMRWDIVVGQPVDEENRNLASNNRLLRRCRRQLYPACQPRIDEGKFHRGAKCILSKPLT